MCIEWAGGVAMVRGWWWAKKFLDTLMFRGCGWGGGGLLHRPGGDL